VSGAIEVTVRLTPRSGRDAVDGVADDGIVRARVSAPPVDGAANKALVRLIAADLGVPRSAVSLVAGASSRVKRLRIAGIDAARVETRWPGVSLGGSMRR
jgi:uncharacterized protein (TIGR00251 family)